ncbi:MAG: 1,4-alpha-glucan branching protein domain-containing protein [Candidatus Syntrophopropionicum ammoniitolerans]
MVDLADLYPQAEGVVRRALNQAARELLLAQSSDWAFIIKTGTAVQYAIHRTSVHINRFNSLTARLTEGHVDEAELAEMEREDNIFPDIEYSIYSRHYRFSHDSRSGRSIVGDKLRVLVLSWEYPPKTVGGLARHVNDLSIAMARLGKNIHVLTCPVEGAAEYELVDGVHVHRVNADAVTATRFMEWVEQLNRAMVELVQDLLGREKFDIIHAHDWLVQEAAIKLRHISKLPLVATIHATEYGRNRGIHSNTQRHIHNLEERLAQSADTVICCSDYMVDEVVRLFSLDGKKVFSIPNGVIRPIWVYLKS